MSFRGFRRFHGFLWFLVVSFVVFVPVAAAQEARVLTLGELKTAQADMFCTVFIGNAAAQAVGGNFITPRGYRDV